MIKHAVVSLACTLLATNALSDELAEQGKKVFTELAQPSCTICHALSDAGSAGEIGPNLDELAPSVTQVQNAVKGGVGLMPAFGDSLSQAQITAVAHYVASVTGGGP
ncbi:SorU family sulfite dehydrogenase c-type cytochrome subunit [Marinobacter sp. F4206]|uniref:SorU family sulfite dehydrogenase c-type cytochrome subunit n=1 Tax=Marinobacter sp. F4206 TaxID=2861777 RepID=UPI001C5F91B4|nr:cytochrome c [Marinobacter sp. F4206]MBW4934492.1 cytochrome c [Marinobacter sp. F4206]